MVISSGINGKSSSLGRAEGSADGTNLNGSFKSTSIINSSVDQVYNTRHNDHVNAYGIKVNTKRVVQ